MPYLLALLILLLTTVARAEDLNQFALASQSDWFAKKGFFLNLDNRYDAQPSSLARLRLVLAVADGSSWKVQPAPETFQFGKTYHVKAHIGAEQATLWLDGRQVQQFAVKFVPHEAQLFAFDNPDWARRPAEYLVLQRMLKVSTGGKTVEYRPEDGVDPRHVLFNLGRAQYHDLKASVPLTIETEFELLPYPSLRKLSPLVDRYGQVNFATWEGKVTSDEALRQILADEEPRLAEWEKNLPPTDRYGGRKDLGFTARATGFFRTEKRDGRWWLISPEGNPLFFTGVCTVPGLTWDATPIADREFLFEWLPPKEGIYGGAWIRGYWGEQSTAYVAFQAANLIVQHGEGWQDKEKARTLRRLKAWGFSGPGKWSSMEGATQIVVLNRAGVPTLERHPDTFDPAIREQFRAVLAKQIAGQNTNPWIIGFSVGHEVDETFTPDELKQILARPAPSPAKRAMIEHAAGKLFGGNVSALGAAWKAPGGTTDELAHQKLTPRAGDVEPLREFVSDQYFAFVYQTMKELAPNHLYLGHWILPTWWHNEGDWRYAARHCDVVGFDLYDNGLEDPKLQKVIAETDKPILCGEFGFPLHYNGQRGFGRFRTGVSDEATYGKHYAEYLRSAATNPYCIGVNLFQYRDQPVTGRGPRGPRGGQSPAAVHGENYAFGLVDVTNRPRYHAIEPLREANLQAPHWHK